MLPLSDGWALLDGLYADAAVNWARVDAHLATVELGGPLRRPVIIAGSYRTGTTFLHRQLAPDFRALAGWEANIPTPDQDPEQLAADTQAGIDALWAVRPELATMQVEGAHLAAECVRAMAHTGITGLWPAIAPCPEYRDFLLETDALDAYRYYDRCLRLLDADASWLLKAPMHSLFLPAIAEVWPDAIILRIRRDPAEVDRSAVRFFSALRRLSQPDVDHEAEVASWVGPYLREHDRRVDRSPLEVIDLNIGQLDVVPHRLEAVRA